MPPILALLISLVLAAPALAQETPKLETNQSYIEQLARKTALPLADPLAMFGYVLGSLPERAKIYPTENYYYFHFMQNGVRYSGNIRLDRSDRDNGKLHFAYYPDRGELQDEAGTYRLLGEADGVKVERLERFLYRVSYSGKSVVFELNDLSAEKPPAGALGPDEKLLGPIFDESGIRFFLIFNPKLKLFHYLLDETVAVPEEFVPAKKSDRILIGKRTGFAFYRDHRLERKILIGVFEGNAMANNYFDGPFDQLPDNFVAGEELRDAILAVDPRLKGKIDRFGSDPDGASRFLIGPYAHYRSEADLQPFHDCAVSKRVPRERYYVCFVNVERPDGRLLAQPAATLAGKRTSKLPRP